MKAVARRTGLSPHVIRVWERRYGAVEPVRTKTNRRRYSDEDVERLALLHELTLAGHSIGAVARLPTEKLRQIALESARADSRQPAAALEQRPARPAEPAAAVLHDSLEAVKALDARRLEETLKRGTVEFGSQGLLQRVIAPLAQRIGDLWRDGTITAAHEHFASAVIRILLGHSAKPFAAAENAPVLVVATPTGQLHELGALLAGAAAANLGWHVIYLGASLPATDIAGAARQNRARAVALSIVYPEDDPRLESELIRLRESLPAEIPLLAGGRAAPAYRHCFEKIGALQIIDLSGLCTALDALRKPAPENP